MGLRIGEIREKGLLGFSLAFDEIEGVVGDCPVDRFAFFAVVDCQFLRRFTSL